MSAAPPAELPYDAVAASQDLAAADPALGDVIARVGPPAIRYRPAETFDALLRSIVFQQLSGKAAGTIHGRVLTAVGDGARADPSAIAGAPDETLRGAGLSGAKAAALRDLASRQLDGTLPPRAALLTMPDEAVVEALTAVRGVGVWTARMVLLFTLGRPDVWPVGDLGVREGYRIVSGAAERPSAKALVPAGEPYRPWRSVAAWYLWRAVDLHRAGGAA